MKYLISTSHDTLGRPLGAIRDPWGALEDPSVPANGLFFLFFTTTTTMHKRINLEVFFNDSNAKNCPVLAQKMHFLNTLFWPKERKIIPVDV